MKDSFLAVGIVLKPQGVKGEIKARALTDANVSLSNVKSFFINDNIIPAESVRHSGDFMFLKLKGIDSRNDAEDLRGLEIFASRSELPPLKKDRFYISDIIGCSVCGENGAFVGKITDILQHGSADVYVCAKEKCMFPAIKSVIINTEIEAKTITVDSNELEKVIVYED
ncbi:MAG: ribosome maturation factor RimM [Firmicutes bacterium]|nr:ribosome maturation factor RimM [Bacillota bacterium]